MQRKQFIRGTNKPGGSNFLENSFFFANLRFQSKSWKKMPTHPPGLWGFFSTTARDDAVFSSISFISSTDLSTRRKRENLTQKSTSQNYQETPSSQNPVTIIHKDTNFTKSYSFSSVTFSYPSHKTVSKDGKRITQNEHGLVSAMCQAWNTFTRKAH